jgi:hypothetical protein
MSAPEISLLIRMALKSDREIGSIFGVINDFACLIEEHLERCAGTDCKNPATVRLSTYGVRMCDACAAKSIVKARRNLLISLPDDPINPMRRKVGDDCAWYDLPNAVRIRRLVEYVSMMTKDDEPDPPEHFDQLH